MINSIFDLLLSQIEEDDRARQAQIRRAWDAYWGRLPKPLRVATGQVDDNVYVNYCRLIVDKGVSFLFGEDVGMEIDELAETAAEAWLDDVWRVNRKMTLLQKVALNGAVAGHAFVKIIERPGQLPRLIALDPETVTVRYAVDDFEDVTAYIIRYPARDPKSDKPLLFREVIERDDSRWRITDEVSDDARLWRVTNETVWGYPFSPVVDCQNLPVPNEYWGMSDLEEDIIGLQQSINFVLSNIARIIRYHAHPKTWGRGFSSRDLRIGVDEVIVFPSAEAELHNLEMQSDLASSIELYKRLREALHEVSRIPEVATGKLDSTGGLSGVALQILYQPLVEKTETKRRMYGDMLIELNRRLLALGGWGDNGLTVIHWPELLPADLMQMRQAALIDQQLGVSQDTILARLGYNPDLERQKVIQDGRSLGEQLLTAFDQGEM